MDPYLTRFWLQKVKYCSLEVSAATFCFLSTTLFRRGILRKRNSFGKNMISPARWTEGTLNKNVSNHDKSCKLGCLIKFVHSIMLTFPGHWGTQLWGQKQDTHNNRCTLGCIMQWSNIFHAESRPQLPLELQMTLIYLWRSSLRDFLREVIICNVNFWRKNYHDQLGE